MKRKSLFNIVILLSLSTLTFHSCKTDDFLDWKARNEMILEQVKSDPDFHTTSTGLVYCIREDKFTSEAKPNSSSVISCDVCKGWLINGYQFQRASLTSSVSDLIPGFQEGIKMIHTHGYIELYIPYTLGYGEEAMGTEGTTSFIPPYSTLHFYIHLSAVN